MSRSPVIEALITRRSVRKFDESRGEGVDEETLRMILEAAAYAPSACNQQPTRFVVLRDKAVREQAAAQHPYCPYAAHAPVCVVVCADTADLKAPGSYWVQDAAASTQNLLVAAHALGLGAVWCGIYPLDERVAAFRALLGIPQAVVPFAIVPIGWPATPATPSQPPPQRFFPDRVHVDKW
jgi:nitroreductase